MIRLVRRERVPGARTSFLRATNILRLCYVEKLDIVPRSPTLVCTRIIRILQRFFLSKNTLERLCFSDCEPTACLPGGVPNNPFRCIQLSSLLFSSFILGLCIKWYSWARGVGSEAVILVPQYVCRILLVVVPARDVFSRFCDSFCERKPSSWHLVDICGSGRTCSKQKD